MINVGYQIRAMETETAEQRSSTATVTIYLRDVNDNAPSFEQTSYEFSISERMSVGELVGTVRVGIKVHFILVLKRKQHRFQMGS